MSERITWPMRINTAICWRWGVSCSALDGSSAPIGKWDSPLFWHAANRKRAPRWGAPPEHGHLDFHLSFFLSPFISPPSSSRPLISYFLQDIFPPRRFKCDYGPSPAGKITLPSVFITRLTDREGENAGEKREGYTKRCVRKERKTDEKKKRGRRERRMYYWCMCAVIFCGIGVCVCGGKAAMGDVTVP